VDNLKSEAKATDQSRPTAQTTGATSAAGSRAWYHTALKFGEMIESCSVIPSTEQLWDLVQQYMQIGTWGVLAFSMVSLGVGAVLYKRWISTIEENMIKATRVSSHDRSTSDSHAITSWMDFMALEEGYEQMNCTHSLKKYFASLRFNKDVDSRELALELVNCLGLKTLLPLVGLAGQSYFKFVAAPSTILIQPVSSETGNC
jgi:hypothetical protein